MTTILELTDEANHKLRSAKDITDRADKENRQPTPAEMKLAKQLVDEADAIKVEIKTMEEAQALRQRVDSEIAALGQPKQRQVYPVAGVIENAVESPVRSVPYNHRRRGIALTAYKGPDAAYNAYKSGQFILASIFDNYRAQRWCGEAGMDIRNALAEGTNTTGGYLVPDEMAQAIIDLRETYGVFRRNAQVLPMGRDTMLIPRKSTRGTATFTGEGVALTSSDPAFNQVQLSAKKLGRVVTVSTELDEDSIIDIAQIVTEDIAYSFALKEDQCGFIGDGSLTYGGMIGAKTKLDNATYAGSKVAAASTHDTFAEIDNTDLASLIALLPQYAVTNAKFYCSQTAFALVFSRLAAIAGGNSIQTLGGAYGPSYLGFPIVISQVLPTAQTAINAASMILFGDLRLSSTMGERRGFSIMRDPSIYFLLDQIAIKATERIDIANHDFGDSTTAGPLVGLHGTT